ncbi:ROK family protein [Tessaracoccus lubricantis]|uniref:ROK family protein n=1 Tax=Tessaracoccus lubricantis TaxID=545543 RepID=A0ABP9F5A2_9ACTN
MARRNTPADLSAAIIGLIGTRGPQSRADLARALDVSAAAVTNLTRQLLADGVLTSVGTSSSGGGRPATLLDIRQGRRRALGVKVTPNHLFMAEVDLTGDPAQAVSVDLDTRAPDALDVIAETIADYAAPNSDLLLGVGMAVPGTVDGGVVTSPGMGWQRVDVARLVRQRVGLPVVIDNNVNALAIAGQLYGRPGLGPDSLLITIGFGIGAAIVSRGQLFRGAFGGAGEFGHIWVDPHGEPCACGLSGCLETLVSDDALARRAQETGAIPDGGSKDDLNEAARAGEQRALEVFATAGFHLGAAVSSLVHVLDPGEVHVSGEGVDVWEFWEPSFMKALRAHLPAHRRDLRVTVDDWAEDAWAHGAASLVFASPFSSSRNNTVDEVRDLLRTPQQ